jgi:hypothetical protein
MAPRFLFDFHSAGGLLGHLRVGLGSVDGSGKWFHDWDEIQVQYVDGRLEYTLEDPAFPGTKVELSAIADAQSAGLILKVSVTGAPRSSLVWAYGGASAFFTNWNMTHAAFNFSPDQCKKDSYTRHNNTFELVRALDREDGILGGEGSSLSVNRYLPDWKAHVQGGSSFGGLIRLREPEAFTLSPGNIAWNALAGPEEASNSVAVGDTFIPEGSLSGYIVVGMGGKITDSIKDPEAAYKAALARNEEIGNRIVVHTPDPQLDAAIRMVAYETEGTWGGTAYLHGAWSWRFAYLGWRNLYGPTIYGWTDRVRKAILAHCTLGRIEEGPDEGGLSSMLESKGFYYNMNEVFIDMVRHYFDYTGDLDLMREIYPVLVGMVEREERRLRPGPEPLYENSLNTWVSDSHWYIQGQCTQASAYMLRAYTFLAELADHLGQDGAAYREQAESIRAAMQEKLWMKREGVFAEYLDTRGNRMLHAEPELPTIYHAAEFGAADEIQIWQMLHWADKNLLHEMTPNYGMLWWSSNWFPNNGRSYTHSTHEMAYAEELNFAETNYLAGRTDEGNAIISGVLSGFYGGPTPGGLSCHCFVDGKQRANDEFADASSMFVRAVVEGKFGIKIKNQEDVVQLSPRIPQFSPVVSVRTPQFSYEMRGSHETISVRWEARSRLSVFLSLPLHNLAVNKVLFNGGEIPHLMRKVVNMAWVEAQTPASLGGEIEVSLRRAETSMAGVDMPWRDSVDLDLLPVLNLQEWTDPQGLFKEIRAENGHLIGNTQGELRDGTFFVSDPTIPSPYWIPIELTVRTNQGVRTKRTRFPLPQVPPHDLTPWTLVDLAGTYNASVPEVLPRTHDGAIPPPMPYNQIGFGYWLDHLTTARSAVPSDEAWRKKVGSDGVTWTADGIPFKSCKEGPNIGAVSLGNNNFPASLSFPVKAAGKTLYLMISGMTHPVQSHVVNLRVTLHYADGASEPRDLVNPFDIGDCWSTWCNLYFDTPANRFENIGGRHGPMGSTEADLTKPVPMDTLAHLLAFDLKEGQELASVGLEAVANDVVFGVMGASVLK